MEEEPSSGVGRVIGRGERSGAALHGHTIITRYALVIATECIQRGTHVLVQDSKLGGPRR
jgi:hypothetical protein